MPRYIVTVRRTELISFEIEAEDEAEAEESYLSDGEEISARTVALDIETVEQED